MRTRTDSPRRTVVAVVGDAFAAYLDLYRKREKVTASGALVSWESWQASADADGSPAQSLRRCDAHAALAAAGAILPARETGTNVMDIVVAVKD